MIRVERSREGREKGRKTKDGGKEGEKAEEGERERGRSQPDGREMREREGRVGTKAAAKGALVRPWVLAGVLPPRALV